MVLLNSLTAGFAHLSLSFFFKKNKKVSVVVVGVLKKQWIGMKEGQSQRQQNNRTNTNLHETHFLLINTTIRTTLYQAPCAFNTHDIYH